jgi:SAM-dependent methyltransferase
MSAKEHWENIYQTKAPTQVSWFQAHPQISLDLIRRTHLQPHEPLIDIGGGASTLVDDLLDDGFQAITVLDISATALQAARQRLGARANTVTWLAADITELTWPAQTYAVWHDRAVFHFLTDPMARQRYIESVRQAVRPGGHVIVATFAPDGPTRCSGLDVIRYSPEGLHSEFGHDFELIDSVRETHHTPAGTEQKFMYCYCRRN